MSDLFDEIRETSENRYRPKCSVQKLTEGDTMPADEREQFLRALADPDVFSTHIARAMTKRGYEFSSFTIQRHRRGDCTCTRGGQQ